MKLTIHLGVHKTASTLLQSAMKLNRQNLKAAGKVPIIRDTHAIIKNTLRQYVKGHQSLIDAQQIWDRFIKKCEKTSQHSILISDENLLDDIASIYVKRSGKALFYPNAAQKISSLNKLFSDQECEWLIYTRQQHTLIPSIYADGLKYFRYSDSLENFCSRIDDKSFRFDYLITEIKKSIGNDTLHVRSYEDVKKDEEAYISTFLGIDNVMLPEQKVNTSISPFQAELFRVHYTDSLDQEMKNNLKAWIFEAPSLQTFLGKNNQELSDKFALQKRFQDDISY